VSDYIPLETEVPAINEVPEDTYNPPKVKKKKITLRGRAALAARNSYSAQSYSTVELEKPLTAGTQSLTPSTTVVTDEPKNVEYKIVRYKIDRRTNLTLAPGDEETIISESEDGEIIGFMMKVDNINMIPEIAIFGDDDTYDILNDDSVLDMIEDGAGLAPGDIDITGSISPDNTGVSDPVFPFVQRAKATTEADILGVSGAQYVVKYRPTISIPYKAISVSIRNNSTIPGTIIKARLHRRIYTTLHTEVGDDVNL
jgi:hypothetical protein